MSEVTDILTQVVALKRNTSYLLDETDIADTLSLDRQPPESCRLEIEVVGNTVSSGLITAYASSGAGVTEYVIDDEVDGNKYGLRVENGRLKTVQTTNDASTNPILEDTLDAGTYYEIVSNYGRLAVAVTTTSQDDSVILSDEEDSTDRKLVISNHALGTSVQSTTSEQFSFNDNDIQVGSEDFTTLDGITTSGITDGFIIVRAVSKLGEPCNQLISINASMNVRFYTQKGRIKAKHAGQDRVAKYKIMAEPDEVIKDNDLIYVNSGIALITMAQLDMVRHIYDFDGTTHHIEAEVYDV